MYVDTTCYFSQKFDRFAFAETRYANSELDFPQVMKNGQRILRSYIAPNNRLSMYGRGRNRGIVNFSDTKAHKVVYVVRDAFANTTRLTFWVKSHLPPGSGVRMEKKPKGTLLSCGKPNSFKADGITLDLPADALYEDLDFVYSAAPAVPGGYGPVHHLQDEYTPVHSACTLALKAGTVPASLAAKALIVKVDENNHFGGRGGKMENGYIVTQIREFGNYTVAVDTVPPQIRPVNVAPDKNVAKQKDLSFRISDNLSGIRSYRGTLNGKWILMDYDAKSGRLVYSFDDRIRSGKNAFKLVVRDAVGNESVYQAALIR
jgi:hypothetical protein